MRQPIPMTVCDAFVGGFVARPHCRLWTLTGEYRAIGPFQAVAFLSLLVRESHFIFEHARQGAFVFCVFIGTFDVGTAASEPHSAFRLIPAHP